MFAVYIPPLILRTIEPKKLLTIVFYDSILNKFPVLYCKDFVIWPKYFLFFFCGKRRKSRALSKKDPPFPPRLTIRTQNSFHHARSAMAAWPRGWSAGLAILRPRVQVPLRPLAGFVHGSPEFKSSVTLVLRPVGILNPVKFK